MDPAPLNPASAWAPEAAGGSENRSGFRAAHGRGSTFDEARALEIDWERMGALMRRARALRMLHDAACEVSCLAS